MADPKEINYAGGQKILNKELTEQKIDEAVRPVITSVTAEVDRATNAESVLDEKITEVVENLATEVTERQTADDEINSKIGNLADLETEAKDNTVAAINEVLHKIPAEPVVDPVPTEGSENHVQSGGTFDAIRFASVKVGETMYWHESEIETREVHSDNPFVFHFKGQEYSVTPKDGEVEMCISKNYPDGWHALNGKAELLAADYPDLAAFMPENVTNDGKIWLPYVQQKIIKVRY